MTDEPFITPTDVAKRIEAFADTSGLAISTICERACGDSRLHRKINDTGECSQKMARRVFRFLDANRNLKRLRNRGSSPTSADTAPVPAE